MTGMDIQRKILCPSILNLAIDNIQEEVKKLDAADIDIYHVDLMDGTFVHNFGMSIRELEMIRRITDGGARKMIDCHMMVMNPHRYVEKVAEAGADIIYIHPESELVPSATLELIQMLGKKTGLILNPCTSLESVKDMLPITDYVMVMGVNPGFAGRDFMPYTREKFLELDQYRKKKNLNYHLLLDGGATRAVITDLYHNCNVEGYVLGKQELFFQKDDYAACVRRIRGF
jgi:ribulose-phosphate 3-epimerase